MSSVLRWRRSRPSRQSVRSRLALRYAIVAFVTGALLLSFAYVVIRHELTPKAAPRFLATSNGLSSPADTASVLPDGVALEAGPVSPLVEARRGETLSTTATTQRLPSVPALSATELPGRRRPVTSRSRSSRRSASATSRCSATSCSRSAPRCCW